VDEDFDKRCPILTIPFDSHGDRAEFSRQIEEQEARLNRMTPTEYLARRTPLTGPGRHDILKSRRRASQPHQDRVREDYIRQNAGNYIRLNGEEAWEEHLESPCSHARA
jgi:hypothetical protein